MQRVARGSRELPPKAISDESSEARNCYSFLAPEALTDDSVQCCRLPRASGAPRADSSPASEILFFRGSHNKLHRNPVDNLLLPLVQSELGHHVHGLLLCRGRLRPAVLQPGRNTFSKRVDV
eukprot:3815446-Pyramimonas_sp.AAC.1